jgi:hypothetical protein
LLKPIISSVDAQKFPQLQPLACLRATSLSLWYIRTSAVLVASSRTSAMTLLVRDGVPRPLCTKSLQVCAG